MLIKKDNRIINFRNVSEISLEIASRLDFHFVNEDCSRFRFNSNEERNKAFEAILDAYRWERKFCDLDKESDK